MDAETHALRDRLDAAQQITFLALAALGQPSLAAGYVSGKVPASKVLEFLDGKVKGREVQYVGRQ